VMMIAAGGDESRLPAVALRERKTSTPQ
jgi:hypothetical protein